MMANSNMDEPGQNVTTPFGESEAQSLLKRFSKQYRDPSILVEILPTFKKRVKRLVKVKDVPRMPEGYPARVRKHGQSHLLKWYSLRNGKMISYYDDGSPLPDTSELHIVSQTTIEVWENETSTQSNTWVLRRPSVED
jgi:hypothetical protein